MSAVYFDQRLFCDRVMQTIAGERPPTPANTLAAAIRRLDANLALAAIWSAWHLATVRSSRVRRTVRVRSAALLAILSLMVAIGTTLAAAGAAVIVHTATQNQAQTPQLLQLLPSLSPRPSPSNDNRALPPVVQATDDLDETTWHSPDATPHSPGNRPPTGVDPIGPDDPGGPKDDDPKPGPGDDGDDGDEEDTNPPDEDADPGDDDSPGVDVEDSPDADETNSPEADDEDSPAADETDAPAADETDAPETDDGDGP